MPSRRIWILAAALLAAAARAETVRLPLDPARLAGAGIFTQAEAWVSAAATAAGLDFKPDARPLPPQAILMLDTPDGKIHQRHGVLFWRGDMLPDQLAPGESGTLVRRHQTLGGGWRTLRRQADAAPNANTNLVPVSRTAAGVTVPPVILETPYQLGTLDGAPVRLVLWRSTAEDSPPVAGHLALTDPAPGLLRALDAVLPVFATRAEWAAEFAAFAPDE